MMKGLAGRVALVTGGSGLIGSAVVRRLLAEGTTVVITSRTAEKAESWAADQSVPGTAKLIGIPLELGDEQSIANALNHLAETVGIPTILIANASLRDGLATPFDELDHASFSRLYNVDVAGHFICARELIKQLAGQAASFVILSSIYAVNAVDQRIYPAGMAPTPPQYSAAKAALLSLTRTLAARWGEQGVRVNAVVAGGVRSSQRQSDEFVTNYSNKTMLNRMAQPDEIANAVAFLASDEASYITGESLMVDGGFSAW